MSKRILVGALIISWCIGFGLIFNYNKDKQAEITVEVFDWKDLQDGLK
jgi:hypothetical protein